MIAPANDSPTRLALDSQRCKSRRRSRCASVHPTPSTTRRSSRSRNNHTMLFHHCILVLSCLLLGNPYRVSLDLAGTGSSPLLAQAFVTTPLDKTMDSHHRRRSLPGSAQPHLPSSPTSTTLHFFFNTGAGAQNGNGRDLPLARYVDVSDNYTLAHTPEDYIELQEGQRLVCVGDVHGDVAALRTFLETAGVWDAASDSWCGGNTILVQCGDILDRGFEELACYRLLAKLSQQALGQDGRVVLLVGNHEALNAMGLFQYACTDREHEVEIGQAVDAVLGVENEWRKQYANNQPSRWASYEPGGLLAHSLLKNMKVAIRVGGTVCVHAGLLPHHLKDNGGIHEMNAAFADWISLGDDLAVENPQGGAKPAPYPPPPPRPNPVVYNHHGQYPTPRQPWIDAEQRQKHYITSIPSFLQSKPEDPGPIWMREFSSPHDAPPNPARALELERDLDSVLTLVGASRMVMGHTIQNRINGIFRGKAWRLDVGASKGCLGGTPEVLEVVCRKTEGSDSEGEGEPTSGTFYEEVSILTPGQGSSSGNSYVPGQKIPAADRLVDAYTQAAVQML